MLEAGPPIELVQLTVESWVPQDFESTATAALHQQPVLSLRVYEADTLQDLVREPVAGLSGHGGTMPNLDHVLVTAVHV